MKPSVFNVYRSHGAQTVVFNTLTGKWRSFDCETASRLRAGKLADLDKRTVADCLAMQAIVSRELDELIRYRSLYQQALHDTRALSLICILTYRCNLRCPYCFEEGVEGARTARMNDQQVERFIAAVKQKCRAEGTRQLSIMLFGGEPLLETKKGHRIFRNLRAWCRVNRIAFTGSMSSNGTLITPQRLSLLAPYLQVVQITFDGPKPIHDQIRVPASKKPTYDRIIQGIRRLLEHRINVQIRIQVSRPNQDRLPELIADLKEKGLVGHPRIRFSISLVTEYSGCGECDLRSLTIDPDSPLGHRIATMSPALVPRVTPATQILPCIMTPNAFCVDPRGRLFKCITAVSEPERAVGRIDAEGRFALNEHYYEYLARNPLEYAECRECALLPLCGGGCPTSAYEQAGTYHRAWCGNNPEILTSRIDSAVGLSKDGDR